MRRQNTTRPSASTFRSKPFLIAGFLVLALLAIPWLNLPGGEADWVAFSYPYQTSTPTATPTATVTLTPPPSIPKGTYSLTGRVFVDYRCDRFFQGGVDIPLGDVSVTISFPDGSSETRQTKPPGLVYFTGFDASDGVTVSVELPESYKGRGVEGCFNSPGSIDLLPGDFRFRHKFVQFGAEISGELAGP